MFASKRAAPVPCAPGHHSTLIIRIRPALMAATAATAAGLLAACGSPSTSQPDAASASSTAAQPSGPPAPPPSSALPAVTPAAPSQSASATPSAVAGLATRQSASLTITVDDSQASSGAGSTYYPLDFTNTSATACQLYGYPGVSLVTAGTGAGQQVGQAAQRGDAFAKVTVRLAPGGTAHAWLKVAVAANYPASSCQPVSVHWLRIYPPGETAADYVAHTFSACSSSSAPLLAILPMRAGRGAQGVTP
jgi:hypothetical protein